MQTAKLLLTVSRPEFLPANSASLARMAVPKLVKNGFYSYFGVWGQL
jgi:hypothetical protein